MQQSEQLHEQAQQANLRVSELQQQLKALRDERRTSTDPARLAELDGMIPHAKVKWTAARAEAAELRRRASQQRQVEERSRVRAERRREVAEYNEARRLRRNLARL